MQMNEKIIEKLRPYLADQSETIVGIIGNKMIEKFIANGTIENGFAILTDRRVYFKGTNFSRKGKSFYKTNEEQMVNVESVTGTKFIHRNPIWWKISSIICYVFTFSGVMSTIAGFTEGGIVGGIVGIAMTCGLLFLARFLQTMYKIQSTSLFEICFAGGGIAFGLNWIEIGEAEDFQKLIQTTKDAAIKNTPNENNSVAEELLKFKKLLGDNIITQEEFDAKKKQLLGL